MMFTGFQHRRNCKGCRTLLYIDYLKVLKYVSFPASANHYAHNSRAPHAPQQKLSSAVVKLCVIRITIFAEDK